MDVVYILKEEENNIDLVYSLRSLYKYVKDYNTVWFSGYKPSWASDLVKYIKTDQSKDKLKWENSFRNVLFACHDDRVSENFALFNDDFFAIRDVCLATDLNYCRGTLDMAINKYSGNIKTRWIKSHKYTKDILEDMGSEHLMDFTLHIPMVINKKRFIELLDNAKMWNYLRKNEVLSYRSIYGNLNWTNPQVMKDVKPPRGKDLQVDRLGGQWISVFDNVTNSFWRYPIIQSVLQQFMGEKSPFEERSII